MMLIVFSLVLCTFFAGVAAHYRRGMLKAIASEKLSDEALVSLLEDGEVHERVRLKVLAAEPTDATPCGALCKHSKLLDTTMMCGYGDKIHPTGAARPALADKNDRCLAYEPSKYAR